ncbi:MAG: DUF418 domain-containing protein [Pseudomonadota bacterium]
MNTTTADALHAEPAPAPADDRHHVLDGLRGFALLGIFAANIRMFAGWEFAGDDLREALAGDYWRAYEFANVFLVDGKFYTLFALLFGIGFSLQLARLDERGADGVALYVRRLLILLVIGVIHLTQFWPGDILTPYALLGFVLLAVRPLSDRRLLIAAAAAFAAPPVGYLAAWGAGVMMDLDLYERAGSVMAAGVPNFEGDLLGALQRPDWTSFFGFAHGAAVVRVGYLLESWRLPKLLFVMLIGLWAGRRIVAGGLLNDDRFLRRVALIGFAVGLPASILYAYLGPVFAFAGPPNLTGLVRMIAYMASVFPLGFAYGAAFVLLWRRGPGVLAILAAPGRMALTNYLLQTAAGVAIFYGVGAGYAGKTPPAAFLAIAVAIYAAQIAGSHAWLSAFKYGPMEWLWRSATYGRLLPARRRAAA